MQEAFYDPTEYRLLCEMLALWDAVQQLKRVVAVHGVSQTDKGGVTRQRPEARMLSQHLQTLLAYTRALKVTEG